MNIAMEMETEG